MTLPSTKQESQNSPKPKEKDGKEGDQKNTDQGNNEAKHIPSLTQQRPGIMGPGGMNRGGFMGNMGNRGGRGMMRGGGGGRGGGRFYQGGFQGQQNQQQQQGQQQGAPDSRNTSMSSQDSQDGNRGGFRGRGRGGRGGGGGGGERREKIVHPPARFTDSGERMFTGRCRLFIGNLPQDMKQDEFEELFKPFGEYQEAFISAGKGFGFIRMDLRENAVKAKKALDGEQKKGRFLRVRFASHAAAIRVKHLPPAVSNEFLQEAFSQFGEVERAVVIIDERGKPTGEGVIEFVRKPGAMMALNKISEGVYLLGSSPRPITAEPLVENDEDDGLSEKFMNKNADYVKEREHGARFANVNSFEYEFGHKWKEMYLMHAEAEENLKRQFSENVAKLEIEQANGQMEYQTRKLREDLARKQEELRKMEESHQREMQLKTEKRRTQEESRRKMEEMRKREEEQNRMKVERFQQEQEERARREHEMQLRELQEMRQMRDELNQMRQQQRQMQQGNNDGGMMGGGNDMMGGRADMMGGGGNNNDGLMGPRPGDGMMGAAPGNMGGRNDQRGGGMMGGNMNNGGDNMPAMKPPPAPPALMLERNRQEGNMGGRGMDNRGRQSRFEQNSGSGFNQGGMGGVGGRGGMDRRDRPDDFFDAKRQRRY